MIVQSTHKSLRLGSQGGFDLPDRLLGQRNLIVSMPKSRAVSRLSSTSSTNSAARRRVISEVRRSGLRVADGRRVDDDLVDTEQLDLHDARLRRAERTLVPA